MEKKTKQNMIQEIETKKEEEWNKKRLEWLLQYPTPILNFFKEMKIRNVYYYTRAAGVRPFDKERLQRLIFLEVEYNNKVFSLADSYFVSGERIGDSLLVNPIFNKEEEKIQGESIEYVLPNVDVEELHDFLFFMSDLGENTLEACKKYQHQRYQRTMLKMGIENHEERAAVRLEMKKRDFFRHIQKV